MSVCLDAMKQMASSCWRPLKIQLPKSFLQKLNWQEPVQKANAENIVNYTKNIEEEKEPSNTLYDIESIITFIS